MTVHQKGDYVAAVGNGSGSLAQGYGRVSYSYGDELLVTSIRAGGHLNVRHAGGGRVFSIAASRVRRIPRMIGEIPEGGIAPEDPRISWLFEDAARMADRLGLCKDFDRICDALGVPGRIRTFNITVMSAAGIEVTAKVQARSRRLAEQRVREQLMPAAPLALEAIRDEVRA